MSAQNRTQDKSDKPEGLENKSLQPTVEDKAAQPAEQKAEEKAEKPAGVEVTLATHYEYGGKHYLPGQTVTVDEATAYSLRVGGIAARS